MRTCYVILSHTDVPQVLALAHRVRELSPGSVVLIRHDQRREALESSDATTAGATLIDSRLPVRWGDWSLVQATLEALEQAKERFDPDFTVLISGQDWPARPLRDWEAESAAYDAVLSARPIAPASKLRRDNERMIADRYDYAWRPLARFWRGYPKIVRSVGAALWYRTVERVRSPILLNKLPRDLGWTVGLRSRALRGVRPMHKGEQWCALSRAAVDAIFRWREEQPSTYAAFRHTLIPDESFIQTIIMNDPTLRTRNSSVSWHRFPSASANHPRRITLHDVERIRLSRAPFARKVGSADFVVRDRLDTLVEAEQASRAT